MTSTKHIHAAIAFTQRLIERDRAEVDAICRAIDEETTAIRRDQKAIRELRRGIAQLDAQLAAATDRIAS